MPDNLSPNPGLQAKPGSEQVVDIWVTELIRLINLKASAIADLNLTVSNPPTQAEGQAMADKIDEILAALRTIAKLEE